MGALLAALGVGTIALHSAKGGMLSPEHPVEQLVLRLQDLPPGFIPFYGFEGYDREFICEPLQKGELPPKAVGFINQFSPEGCWGFYIRRYRVPGIASPSLAGTGALDAHSPAGAASGFAVAPLLLADFTEKGTKNAPTPEIVGDATQLFHLKTFPLSLALEGISVARSRSGVRGTSSQSPSR